MSGDLVHAVLGDEPVEFATAGELAAVHLLTFTELPHRRGFADLVDVETVDAPDGPVLAAFVRDWTALHQSPAAERLSGAHDRMLALAVSLATGEPVDLAGTVGVGGHAHARQPGPDPLARPLLTPTRGSALNGPGVCCEYLS